MSWHSRKQGRKAPSRPAKGYRKGIRRKKAIERQKAFEDLMAEQRRTNFKVDKKLVISVRREAAAMKEKELEIPNDQAGALIRQAGAVYPRKEERMSWTVFAGCNQRWYQMHGKPLSFPCPATYAHLHLKLTRELDPVWRWIGEIDRMRGIFLDTNESNLVAEWVWRIFVSEARDLGVQIPDFRPISSPTLGDLYKHLKDGFDKNDAAKKLAGRVPA